MSGNGTRSENLSFGVRGAVGGDNGGIHGIFRAASSALVEPIASSVVSSVFGSNVNPVRENIGNVLESDEELARRLSEEELLYDQVDIRGNESAFRDMLGSNSYLQADEELARHLYEEEISVNEINVPDYEEQAHFQRRAVYDMDANGLSVHVFFIVQKIKLFLGYSKSRHI